MLLRRAAIYTVWQNFRTVKKCQIFDNYDFFGLFIWFLQEKSIYFCYRIWIETLDYQDIKPITFLLGTLAPYDLKYQAAHWAGLSKKYNFMNIFCNQYPSWAPGGAAHNQRERERDNISNRLQIGNKCTRSVWIFSLPKLPMIGMQESYYYIYIVYMYVPTKTKTHNSTFSSLKNQLHERDRKNVLCNIGTVYFILKQDKFGWLKWIPMLDDWCNFYASLSLVVPFLHMFLKSSIVFLMYQWPDQSVPVDPLQETITNEERREVLTTTGV